MTNTAASQSIVSLAEAMGRIISVGLTGKPTVVLRKNFIRSEKEKEKPPPVWEAVPRRAS